MFSFKFLLKFVFGAKKLNIGRKDLVLEIGAGGNPYFRSDVLLDKYIDDSTERSSSDIFIDRPFVVGDAVKMPFKNKAFDYIIAKNILEHINNPEVFFKELMRVGKAGYIESPNKLTEKIFGYRFHRWLIDLEQNTIVMERKKKAIEDPLLHDFFHKARNTDKNFFKFFWHNLHLFRITHEWNGKIEYEISWPKKVKEDVEFETSKADIDYSQLGFQKLNKKVLFKKKIFYRFLKLLKFIYSGKKRFDIYDLLACPVCKKGLLKKDDLLICTQCNKEYKIVNDVPIML